MSNEGIIVNPPPNYVGSNKWMSWHGYRVEIGPNIGPHVLNEFQSKLNSVEACIVVCTGPARKGKTYFTLRLAQILDKKFDVNKQVCFGPEELMSILSGENPLGMGRVIIIDESQFAISSRDWASSTQKTIMKHLEAIRSKGFIIFIVALSESTLDVIARSYVITHKIHLMKRGRARVYSYHLGPFSKTPYPKTISTDFSLSLPDAEKCKAPSCLRCKFSGVTTSIWRQRNKWDEKQIPLCQTIRAKYERKKKLYLEQNIKEEAVKTKPNVIKKATVEDAVKAMMENSSELKLSSQGNISTIIAVPLVKRFYPDISERKVLKAVGLLSQDPIFCSKLNPKK